MPQTQLEEGRDLAAPPPDGGESVDAMSAYMTPVMALGTPGFLGTREQVEKEIDLIAAAVRTFYAKPADMVMRECSAYTARLTELCVLLHRHEGDRGYMRIRTQQAEKFLAELDRQWRTASRLIEVQRQDLVVMGGQT